MNTGLEPVELAQQLIDIAFPMLHMLSSTVFAVHWTTQPSTRNSHALTMSMTDCLVHRMIVCSAPMCCCLCRDMTTIRRPCTEGSWIQPEGFEKAFCTADLEE